MVEAWALQLELKNEKIQVVYCDEFKYSWHSNKHYGWSIRGKSGHFKLLPSNFQATFMIAFSSTKIHGVMASALKF